MTLEENGKFHFIEKTEWTKLVLDGNWQIRGNNLILDSSPQRDRLIVIESLTPKLSYKLVNVTNKGGENIHYYLYGITASNDTIALRDQYISSKIDKRINTFYLISTGGLKSPLYTIQGSKTNTFDVLFETTRVFENESWEINGHTITPNCPGGYKQNFKLTKSDNPQ